MTPPPDWYFVDDNSYPPCDRGPYSDSELIALAKAGQLGTETIIFSKTRTDNRQVPVSAIPKLRKHVRLTSDVKVIDRGNSTNGPDAKLQKKTISHNEAQIKTTSITPSKKSIELSSRGNVATNLWGDRTRIKQARPTDFILIGSRTAEKVIVEMIGMGIGATVIGAMALLPARSPIPLILLFVALFFSEVIILFAICLKSRNNLPVQQIDSILDQLEQDPANANDLINQLLAVLLSSNDSIDILFHAKWYTRILRLQNSKAPPKQIWFLKTTAIQLFTRSLNQDFVPRYKFYRTLRDLAIRALAQELTRHFDDQAIRTKTFSILNYLCCTPNENLFLFAALKSGLANPGDLLLVGETVSFINRMGFLPASNIQDIYLILRGHLVRKLNDEPERKVYISAICSLYHLSSESTHDFYLILRDDLIRKFNDEPTRKGYVAAICSLENLTHEGTLDCYQAILDILEHNSTSQAAKIIALEIGRHHFSRIRPEGQLTIYDEQAIQNDIITRSRSR